MLVRLRQARCALLGEAPRRGRSRQVDEKKMDEIAQKFFISYFQNHRVEPSLGGILKDVLVPDRHKKQLTDKEIENIIKRYRKAFQENKDWLLLRNTEMLDAQYTLSITAPKAIAYLLSLTGKTTPK